MSSDARHSLIAWGVVLGLLGLGWLGIFPDAAFWGNAIAFIVLPLLIAKGLLQAQHRKPRIG